ncbi:ABC transporter permease [uncultured Bifidobacterium sp.]|uniref:ABC transporter permease n=1 Tax=uncultured Bifidobacterium sp. TaxID=165187 RepID=UPI0028DCEE87|nr:ABC transporter permease [uncultured Bifidobacterium sp.]
MSVKTTSPIHDKALAASVPPRASESSAPLGPSEPESGRSDDSGRDNPALQALTVVGRGFSTVWSVPKARFGLVLFGLIVLIAVLAPVISPYDPSSGDFAAGLGPTSGHWLGTTANGQDVLSQLIWGGRISVMVAMVAGLLSTIIAVIVGLGWGYMRSFAGEFIGFIVNLFLVVPSLPLMIVIAAYLQNGGISVIILVIVFTGWAWGSRVLRSQTQTLRSRDFVTAAQFSGDGSWRIIFHEIFPNMLSLIINNFFGAATAAALAEAGLEFLGLGDSTTVSWGTMIYWAQNNNVLLTGQWALLLAPGLMIALLAVSMTFINFGVDRLSNPRLREGSSR